ncbi:MAG: hypothetical protein ACREVI_05585 [Steroidobacteraceae bacterium]
MNATYAQSFAAVLCIALGLAACGKQESAPAVTDPPKPPAAAAVTACDLVTKDEGAAALGEAVDEPVEQIISAGSAELAAMSMCTVQATAAPGKTLSLSFRRSPVPDNQPESVRGTLTDSGVRTEDVPGIGDTAFWGASELHVFFGGNSYLSVSVRGLDDGPEARAKASDAARKAIDRSGG